MAVRKKAKRKSAATGLAHDLENVCTPEEAEKRVAWARQERAAMMAPHPTPLDRLTKIVEDCFGSKHTIEVDDDTVFMELQDGMAVSAVTGFQLLKFANALGLSLRHITVCGRYQYNIGIHIDKHRLSPLLVPETTA